MIAVANPVSQDNRIPGMRKNKWLPVPCLLNQLVADRKDGAPRQGATQHRAQIVNLIQELLQDP